MTTWFTSDLHFGHKNIIKYCNRPWTANKVGVLAMGEALIANWNAVVAPDDVVYNLGDLAFCTGDEYTAECVARLNGDINHVRGNHDEIAFRLYAAKRYGVRWHSDVYEVTPIEDPPQTIVLCHYAMREWHHALRGTWHLFGHTHNILPPFGKSVDVGVDSTWVTGKAEYRPFSFAEIKAFMDKQPIGQHAEFGNGFVPGITPQPTAPATAVMSDGHIHEMQHAGNGGAYCACGYTEDV